MKTEAQLRVYLVANPVPFKRYEDHEAALQIQLYDLIERAIEEKENPVALIEDNLGITYTGSDNIDDIASFLLATDQMSYAMNDLKDNWYHLDESQAADSLLYNAGIDRADAVRIFSEITLRNYLENLATLYTHHE